MSDAPMRGARRALARAARRALARAAHGLACALMAAPILLTPACMHNAPASLVLHHGSPHPAAPGETRAQLVVGVGLVNLGAGWGIAVQGDHQLRGDQALGACAGVVLKESSDDEEETRGRWGVLTRFFARLHPTSAPWFAVEPGIGGGYLDGDEVHVTIDVAAPFGARLGDGDGAGLAFELHLGPIVGVSLGLPRPVTLLIGANTGLRLEQVGAPGLGGGLEMLWIAGLSADDLDATLMLSLGLGAARL